jgi:hypothetical protein
VANIKLRSIMLDGTRGKQSVRYQDMNNLYGGYDQSTSYAMPVVIEYIKKDGIDNILVFGDGEDKAKIQKQVDKICAECGYKALDKSESRMTRDGVRYFIEYELVKSKGSPILTTVSSMSSKKRSPSLSKRQ